jgi:hypothetical protein
MRSPSDANRSIAGLSNQIFGQLVDELGKGKAMEKILRK